MGISFIDNILVNQWISRMWFPGMRMFFYGQAGLSIDQDSTIHRHVLWHKPDKVIVGQRSHIGSYCFVDGRGEVAIGNDVNISQFCRFISGNHDLSDPDYRSEYKPIIIEDFAWLATGATVLGGTTVGSHAVVAAGACVTKDVLLWTIVGGVPARIIRKIEPFVCSVRTPRALPFQ